MQERSWVVVPRVGVGPLRFGTPREALRAALGPAQAFRRVASSVHLTDQYVTDLLMLTCSEDEGLYLIEIPDPIGVHYRGVSLAATVGDVLVRLRAAGVEPTATDSGWHFADGAVALYVPSSEPDATVEAVTLFGPGHDSGGEIVNLPAGAAAPPPTKTHTIVPGGGLGTVAFGQCRVEVRTRLNRVLCRQRPSGAREPVQDHFVEDGLVVEYGPDLGVARIFVTGAERADLHGVNLMPKHPITIDDVRSALTAAGYELAEGEAVITLAGTGVEVWTALASAEEPLAVTCVAISPLAGRDR